jgi:hypothetical protein
MLILAWRFCQDLAVWKKFPAPRQWRLKIKLNKKSHALPMEGMAFEMAWWDCNPHIAPLLVAVL